MNQNLYSERDKRETRGRHTRERQETDKRQTRERQEKIWILGAVQLFEISV